jgi:hypothetical protein
MWLYWLYDRNATKISSIDSMNQTRKRGWLNYFSLKRSTRKVHVDESSLDTESYKAAGTVFTDGRVFLAGHQPHKHIPMISGIGGKREDGEKPMYTAIRETLEELFEFKNIPKAFIEEVMRTISPQRIMKNGSYVFIQYDFDDLVEILRLIKKRRMSSPIYKKIPDSLINLILTRIVDNNSEITHLALLPLVPQLKIDKNLIDDVPIIKGLNIGIN